MKIVIVGDGKVGYNIAKQLLAEGHDIVVIDNNPELVSRPVKATPHYFAEAARQAP